MRDSKTCFDKLSTEGYFWNMITLTDSQLDRHARHIVLPEIGGAGQVALGQSHVVLIGAGGIGAPALLYLAAAGVGKLTIIDDDVIALSNLHRQIAFDTVDIGAPKVDGAEKAIKRINPDVTVMPVETRITADNADALLKNADALLDGSDNFATRLCVSDASVRLQIPLVSAAIGRFQGQISTFRGWEADKPCYRCFVGDAFDAEDCDSCADVGVLGPMVGMLGCFAAMEAIRALTGFGADPAGKLQLIDGLEPSMRAIRIIKDPACGGCGVTKSSPERGGDRTKIERSEI